MGTDNRIFCYRPNGTVYAVFSPTEWADLRKRGVLDAELAKRRESGEIIAAERGGDDLNTSHVRPRVYPRGQTFAAFAPVSQTNELRGARITSGALRTLPASSNE